MINGINIYIKYGKVTVHTNPKSLLYVISVTEGLDQP